MKRSTPTNPSKPPSSIGKRTTPLNGKDKHPGGRPPIYNADYHPELAYKFCLLGCTDKRLAELFEVDVDTIDLWKRTHPEFIRALREGKEVADAEVVKSLYHRAIGYSHKESKIATHMGEITDEMKVTKHYPPDTAAAQLCLTNRTRQKPLEEKWVVKQEHDLRSPDGSMTPQSSVIVLPAKEKVV